MKTSAIQLKLALIAQAIHEHLSRNPHLSVADSVSLRRSIRNGIAVDYASAASAFAVTFWERNFWKAAYFMLYEYQPPAMLASRLIGSDSVLDITVLGAGSAADTVACLATLDSMLPLQKIRITLIDRSQQQLDLAREIIGIAMAHLDQTNIDIRCLHLNASQWNPKKDSADLVLMSHFLTENAQETDMLIAKVLTSVRPRGDVVVIERQRDPVWEWARKRLALSGVSTYEVGLSGEKFPLLTPAMPEAEASITPHYVRGSVPEWKDIMELVRGYFQAWMLQTSDGLGDIFTPDATYHEKPGIEPPLMGLDDIRRYWDKHPGQQRNIVLEVHNVAYAPTGATCTWTGNFDTQKQHIAITGGINFFFDSHQGGFNKLTEYFGTVKTPHAPAA